MARLDDRRIDILTEALLASTLQLVSFSIETTLLTAGHILAPSVLLGRTSTPNQRRVYRVEMDVSGRPDNNFPANPVHRSPLHSENLPFQSLW
jgi:hypothetical protein